MFLFLAVLIQSSLLVPSIANFEMWDSGLPLSVASQMRQNYIKSCPSAISPHLPTDWLLQTNFTQALTVTVTLKLYRFIEIDDLGQSLSLFALMSFTWGYPCEVPRCSDLLTFTGLNYSAESLCKNRAKVQLTYYSESPSYRAWSPGLLHTNAVTNSRAYASQATQAFQIFPFFPPQQAFWVTIGRIDSSCAGLSFRRFPFDTMFCTMVYSAESDTRYAYYTFDDFSIDVSARTSFIDDSEIWELVEDSLVGQSENVTQFSSDIQVSRVTFTIAFRRKPYYFAANIFIPVTALFALQLAGLIMPPEEPERSTFGVTVVLAFSVLLGMVFSQIPRTAEPVYVIDMVTAKFICGMILTLYELAACAVCNAMQAAGEDHHKTHVHLEMFDIKLKSPFPWLSLVRCADLIVGVVFILVELASNTYFFWNMMCGY